MPQSTQSVSTTSESAARRDVGVLMRLYALIWWVSFAAFTCAMFVWAILLLPLLLVDRRGGLYHVTTVCVWGWAVYALNPFWCLEVEGRRNLPWNSPAVLVPNHDSLADILVLGSLFRPFKFVSKKSVFAVPILGWAMRINRYVELQRGNRESVEAMFAQCRTWLARDMPVLIFPEGSRSPDGTVQPFKNGAFQLAIEAGVPVYPVVVTGTRDALPKHGLIAPLRSHVKVKLLRPIHADEFDGNLERFREHVRSLIVAEKAKLARSLPE